MDQNIGPFRITPEHGGSLFVGTSQTAAGMNRPKWAIITGSAGTNPTFYSWQECTPVGLTLSPETGGMSGTTALCPAIDPNNGTWANGSFVKVRRAYFDPQYDWVFYIELGGSATALTVERSDGSESVPNVTDLQFDPPASWTITNVGGGKAKVTPAPGNFYQDGIILSLSIPSAPFVVPALTQYPISNWALVYNSPDASFAFDPTGIHIHSTDPSSQTVMAFIGCSFWITFNSVSQRGSISVEIYNSINTIGNLLGQTIFVPDRSSFSNPDLGCFICINGLLPFANDTGHNQYYVTVNNNTTDSIMIKEPLTTPSVMNTVFWACKLPFKPA